MEERRTARLVAIGSELLAGHGDQRATSWFGRVLARTPREELYLEPYVLARPKETTEGLASRWLEETEPRLSTEHPNYLLVSLSEYDAEQQLSSARSRLSLANILDHAPELAKTTKQNLKILVVGPPPVQASPSKLAELNAAFQEVCVRRRLPYVDTFTPLLQHEQWRSDIATSDGPIGQAGHGFIACLLLHRGWYQWLGLNPPS